MFNLPSLSAALALTDDRQPRHPLEAAAQFKGADLGDTALRFLDEEAAADRVEADELAMGLEQTESLIAGLRSTTDPKALLAFANLDGNLALHVPAVESFDPDDTVALEGLLASLTQIGARVKIALAGKGVREFDEKSFRYIEFVATERQRSVHDAAVVILDRFNQMTDMRWFDVEFGKVLTPQEMSAMLGLVEHGRQLMTQAKGLKLPSTQEEATHYFAELNKLMQPYGRYWKISVRPSGAILSVGQALFGEGRSSLKHPIDHLAQSATPDTLRERGFTSKAQLIKLAQDCQKAGELVSVVRTAKEAILHAHGERKRLEEAGEKEAARFAGLAATALFRIAQFIIYRVQVKLLNYVMWHLEYISDYVYADVPKESWTRQSAK